MNPLISIVIPTFNREHLILDALETCVLQTYRPIEIVVVDDGSTDRTTEFVEDWIKGSSHKEVTLKIIKQENKGGNVARNNGIKNTIGEFIAFLDSDDLWDTTKLKKQYALISQSDTIGGVYCGLRQVEVESGKVISDDKRNYTEGFILSQILVKDITAPTSAYLVRKKVFDLVGGFDETLQARQDWDMWIRLAEKYEIRAVHENLMDLRHHKGTRTASDPHKEINAYIKIRQKHQYLIDKQPINIKKEAKANFYKRLGRVYFHHNISKRIALSYYIKGILLFPKDFDNWAALIGFFLPKIIRTKINGLWNKIFSKTKFAIRSH
jgi:glycosyltransferase involved in cell wall biosynthesis